MAESGMLRTGASVLARNPEFGQEGGGKGGGVGVGGKHRVLGWEARGTPFLCICHLLATQCGKVDKPILQMRKLRPKEGKGERHRGRETSVCGCLLHTSYWGPGPQPRCVP